MIGAGRCGRQGRGGSAVAAGTAGAAADGRWIGGDPLPGDLPEGGWPAFTPAGFLGPTPPLPALLASGRAAIAHVLEAFGVGGGAVLVPASGCAALTQAVRMAGASPAYYPGLPDLQPDGAAALAVAHALGADARAVIWPHAFGRIARPPGGLLERPRRQWLASLELPAISREVIDAPLPGVGPCTALVLLAEIGDITRFSSARKLASWAGLTPTVRGSDRTVHHGHISKKGPTWVRWVACEAAQTAKRHPDFAPGYEALARRRGKKIAHRYLRPTHDGTARQTASSASREVGLAGPVTPEYAL